MSGWAFRRGGSVHGARRGGGVVGKIAYISGFVDTTAKYQCASGTPGIAGNATGFWLNVGCITLVDPSSTHYIFGAGTNPANGFGIYCTGTNNVIFRVVDGVGTSVDSPAVAVSTSKLIHVFTAVRAAATVRCVVNKTDSGTTAISGYTATGVGNCLGSRNGALSATEWGIWGASGSDSGTLTVAQAQDLAAACKSLKDISNFAGTEKIWSVRRNGIAVPSTFKETLGTGHNMILTGTAIAQSFDGSTAWAF